MSDVNYLEDELALAEAQERNRGLTAASVVNAIRVNFMPILLTILAVAVGYFLLAMTYTLLKPVQRQSTLGFRLEFPGADNGEYPNGIKFSGGDIIDTPVLRTVYDANQLGRFMSFRDFSRSVVVLEANAALDALSREYEAKLANPRLTAVERERLEAQFSQKRASLRKNEFSLNLTTREGITRVPTTVTAKVLSDILRTWAEFAANRRQVLLYRVPLVSQQTVGRRSSFDDDVLSSLLFLRVTAVELQNNIDALDRLPGAEVIRSAKRGVSLTELDLELAQIQRAGIEYLIMAALRSGTTDRARAVALVESQLAYDSRVLQAAEDRVRVLRASLEDYLRKTTERTQSVVPQKDGERSNEDAVVINESFLDRIVELASDASDLEYRQRYSDDIRNAALATVPLRGTVEYQRELLASIRGGAAGNGPVLSAEALRSQHDAVVRDLQQIAADLADVRAVLSRGLITSSQMYTVTGPPVSIAERGVSMAKLAMGGIVVVILAAILAILGAVLQQLFRKSGETATA
jgi:hypothetical protein